MTSSPCWYYQRVLFLPLISPPAAYEHLGNAFPYDTYEKRTCLRAAEQVCSVHYSYREEKRTEDRSPVWHPVSHHVATVLAKTFKDGRAWLDLFILLPRFHFFLHSSWVVAMNVYRDFIDINPRIQKVTSEQQVYHLWLLGLAYHHIIHFFLATFSLHHVSAHKLSLLGLKNHIAHLCLTWSSILHRPVFHLTCLYNAFMSYMIYLCAWWLCRLCKNWNCYPLCPQL